MARKICKYENVAESGDVICLINSDDNCLGSDKCECFINQTDTEKIVCGALVCINCGERYLNKGYRVALKDICDRYGINEGDVIEVYIKKVVK